MWLPELRRETERHIAALADWILPRECAVCGDRLNISEKHICINCLADMPYTMFWQEKRNRMADSFNEALQRDATDYEPYASAVALFFYQSGYRNIPQAVKYRGNTGIGRYFGNVLAGKISSAAHFSDIDMVIPVPLHWTRLWKRGYNQAETIAGAIAERLGVPMNTRLLYRRRKTRTQTQLDVEHKAVNVRGAFGTRDAEKPEGIRHILIVDDVFTTGATMKACYTALRNVFPPSVRISVATLAFVGD